MRRRTATALEEKPVYTLAEVGAVLRMLRSTGHPDTSKVERHLRRLGVPVVAGRPKLVEASELLARAPRLYQVLLGTRAEHRTTDDL
jgi:hypothetical protein